MGRELAIDPVALGRAVDDALASKAGAWAGGQAAVEGFLRRVVADLNRLPRWSSSMPSSGITARDTRPMSTYSSPSATVPGAAPWMVRQESTD